MVELSKDQKPVDPLERDRIENAGGSVDNNGRIDGLINVARSFGDFSFKLNNNKNHNKQLIISEPVLTSFNMNEFKFITLGCDGMFEFWSNQEIVEWFDKSIVE